MIWFCGAKCQKFEVRILHPECGLCTEAPWPFVAIRITLTLLSSRPGHTPIVPVESCGELEEAVRQRTETNKLCARCSHEVQIRRNWLHDR